MADPWVAIVRRLVPADHWPPRGPQTGEDWLEFARNVYSRRTELKALHAPRVRAAEAAQSDNPGATEWDHMIRMDNACSKLAALACMVGTDESLKSVDEVRVGNRVAIDKGFHCKDLRNLLDDPNMNDACYLCMLPVYGIDLKKCCFEIDALNPCNDI